MALTFDDPDHSFGEERFLTFGMSSLTKRRLLLVSHTDSPGVIRIISAREMTKSERRIYDNDDIKPEYSLRELGQGIRGKYLKDSQKGSNLVLLDADVAAAFPDHKVLNDTLRALISIAKNTSSLSSNQIQ